MQPVRDRLLVGEAWLLKRVRVYARGQGFGAYVQDDSPALVRSVSQLVGAVCASLERPSAEVRPTVDDDDPMAVFGRRAARAHHARGVPIAAFFGLIKYYRQAFSDLMECLPDEQRARYQLGRCFDRMEIAATAEWVAAACDMRAAEAERAAS